MREWQGVFSFSFLFLFLFLPHISHYTHRVKYVTNSLQEIKDQ